MAKDAATIATRWANNLGASTQKITEGVDAVTVSPGTLAARQVDVWANNTMASKDKFRRNVGRVQLGDWQSAMKIKGIGRIQQGATEAIPKMQNFLTSFLPHVEAGVRALPPRGNLAANINRAVAMINHNAKFVMPGGA